MKYLSISLLHNQKVIMGCCASIPYSEVGIVEKWGDFDRTISPGCHCFNCCCGVKLKDTVSVRVQQLGVKCDTKTRDDVTVEVEATVQYKIAPEQAKEAYYSLDSPKRQIMAYVLNSVRSSVPKMTLDEVYENKDQIAIHVKEELEEIMSQYGIVMVGTLITDINPDKKVVAAMNEINAAQRLRIAASDKAEADKILVVKAAEADAESKFLSGQGIARQRKAIIDGLSESVSDFSEAIPGTDPKSVMELVVMTQYFDTLKDVAGDARSKVIFLPSNPGAVNDITSQLRDGVMQGMQMTD